MVITEIKGPYVIRRDTVLIDIAEKLITKRRGKRKPGEPIKIGE